MAKSWDQKDNKQIRLEAAQRLDPRAPLYNVNPEVAVELLRMQQGKGDRYTSTESVFAALPTAPSIGEFAKTGAFATARAIFEDEAEQYFELGGNQFANLADDPRDHVQEPAPITVKPTSTTNHNRPRTVAAGYRPGTSPDGRKGTLTVIFRDGTYYNYYEVSPQTWHYFKIAQSKGRFIRKYLDSKPRGYADISYITALGQIAQYKISRTNQILYQGRQGSRPLRQPSLERRLLMQERSARRAARIAKSGASNPATANKPTKRRTS
jgi:hypothetical protein